MDTDSRDNRKNEGVERFPVRMDARGRITIPKPLRDAYELRGGSVLEIVPEESGVLIRVTPAHPVDSVWGTVTLQYASSVDEYIEEIRGR